MSRTKVTNLVRVRQGKHLVEFDYDTENSKLTIEIQTGEGTAKVSLGGETIDALRTLLMSNAVVSTGKLATKLPEGTTREGDKPPADGQLTERELAEGAEHPIEGMG